MGKGRDFLLSSVLFIFLMAVTERALKERDLPLACGWSTVHSDRASMWSSWCLEHGKRGIRAQGILAFLSPFAFSPEPQPMGWCQPKSGWASFLSEGLPRRGSPRWFPIQASGQWRLVITPGVRSHPNPANKQTNKEVHGFLGDWTYDLMITCRCSPTMESYKAFFCFLCGTIGTWSCLIHRMVAYLSAVCFLKYTLMAGIRPYLLHSGS